MDTVEFNSFIFCYSRLRTLYKYQTLNSVFDVHAVIDCISWGFFWEQPRVQLEDEILNGSFIKAIILNIFN